MENKSFQEIVELRFDAVVKDKYDVMDISEEIFDDYYSQKGINEDKN